MYETSLISMIKKLNIKCSLVSKQKNVQANGDSIVKVSVEVCIKAFAQNVPTLLSASHMIPYQTVSIMTYFE